MIVSFPKKFKQITFDGGKYYHGSFNVFINLSKSKNIRKIIIINLWKKNQQTSLFMIVIN